MSANGSGNTVTIESIKAKKNVFTLVFSNGDKMELSADTFTEFRLYAGKQMDWAEYERLIAFSRQDEAYRLALKRLSHDLYSKRDMREYLLGKGQDPRVVDLVLNRLIAADLINDKRYAVTFAEDIADLRLLGKNQIIFLLRGKGISPAILEILQFPREKELDKAIRFAQMGDKRYHRIPKNKRVQKLAYALLQRGFDESVAFEAAEKCATPDDPEVKQNELDKAVELAIAKYSRKYKDYDLRQHVYAYLARRGYDYDDIKQACEEAKL